MFSFNIFIYNCMLKARLYTGTLTHVTHAINCLMYTYYWYLLLLLLLVYLKRLPLVAYSLFQTSHYSITCVCYLYMLTPNHDLYKLKLNFNPCSDSFRSLWIFFQIPNMFSLCPEISRSIAQSCYIVLQKGLCHRYYSVHVLLCYKKYSRHPTTR